MQSLGEILYAILDVARWVLILHIVMGWLISFQVLNFRQPLVAQIYTGIDKLLEPLYRPLRQILPSAGGMDFSPIVILLGIFALQRIIVNNLIY